MLVARCADHHAVDGSLPFNLDPAALTTGNVVTIGAFGDDPFNRCQNRQPLLGDLSIVGLDDELQTRMQVADQMLLSSPRSRSRACKATRRAGIEFSIEALVLLPRLLKDR